MGRLGMLGVFAVVAVVGACSPPSVAQRTVPSDPTLAAAMMIAPAGPEPGPDPEPEPDPEPVKYRVLIAKVALADAEDGTGKTIPATDPRALDLHGPVFPVRALDPVLHVGPLHFHHYTFPAKGVLRYAVADVALLPDGAEVYLQWGDDEGSRIDITRALEVPK